MLNVFSDITLGADYLGGGRCRFTLWAPFSSAAAVLLLGPETRTFPLESAGDGYYSSVVEPVPPGTRYFFRLFRQSGGEGGEDDFEDLPDPASRRQPEGVHGPSQVVSPSFEWKETGWLGIPLSRYIITEIHVGAFSSEGTFDGVIPHLKRLKEIGFTAVELMPVAQFPGARNWGYDGVYPFAVQESYGGRKGLKRLVEACHGEGLAVVLDVVYNHLGPEGNYFRKFGPYFTDFYRTPWGEAVNFDGPGSDPVRRFFIENALYWVSEFRIDALRLDAVHAIFDFSAFPFLEQLALYVRRTSEKLNRKIYCIAESALNDARLLRSRSLGGFELDAQWNDDFHHCLHVTLTGEKTGYYQDYDGLKDFVKAWRDGFVYSGQYSSYRRRRHGNSSRDVPARRFVVCAQNHDQVGNRMLGERLSALVSFEKLKLAAGLVLLSPFIPLLFMGEEYGETAPFQYFISHSDPNLVDAVRKGRIREFKSFGWKETPPDPQDETVFLRSRIRRELADAGTHQTLLFFHKELMRLRKKVTSLCLLSKKNMSVRLHEQQDLFTVRRWSEKDEVFIIFRFGDGKKEAKLSIPGGAWEKILSSWGRNWDGPGEDLPATLNSGRNVIFRLPPDGLALYYRKISPFEDKAR